MSIPTDFNPLGTTMQSGMWIDNGVLRGNLFSTYANTSITSVDPRADTSGIVNGSYMFSNCTGLREWNADLPNLTNGSYMFYYCTNLKEWNREMPELKYGTSMFRNTKISSWNIDLSKLVNGDYMFGFCNLITSWTVELPKLQSGRDMFRATKISSWSVDLPELTDGYDFFWDTPITHFRAKLPKLTAGGDMFNSSLDEESVLYILRGDGIGSDYEGIPTYTSGSHSLRLGKLTNIKYSEEIAALLNTTTPIAAKNNYSYKGWTITVTN